MKIEVDLKFTPLLIAQAFCEMNDEDQAQFFIETARIASKWPTTNGMPRNWQWYLVGRHLRSCSCATEDARDLVREIAEGIEAAARTG